MKRHGEEVILRTVIDDHGRECKVSDLVWDDDTLLRHMVRLRRTGICGGVDGEASIPDQLLFSDGEVPDFVVRDPLHAPVVCIHHIGHVAQNPLFTLALSLVIARLCPRLPVKASDDAQAESTPALEFLRCFPSVRDQNT